jgi:tetratricopeptide (TPR) repeat protein
MACGARGEERGVLLNVMAPALFYQHDFAAGWQASCEALELLPPGHPKRVSSLSANTFAAAQLGKVADAQIQELLAATPDPRALGEYVSALGYAGIAHIVLGNRALAVRLIDRLLELEPQFGEDAFSHGHLHYWQMRYLEMLGDDTLAAWLSAQRAVEHNRRAGNRRMLSCSLASLGECTWRLYSLDEGEGILREAVALARDVGEPISYSFVLHYLAQLLAERGSLEAAAEADVLAQQATELAGDGQLYHALARCARSAASLVRHDAALALAHAREARRIVVALRVRAFRPRVDIALGRALLAAGDAAGAAEVADESTRLLAELGPMGVSELPLRLGMAHSYLAAGRRKDAVRATGAALAVLRQRASAITDGARREEYLTRIPENVALRALGRELDASPF